jgi:26S proteasome regulatory subunit N2
MVQTSAGIATDAAGILALLDESNEQLKINALERLNDVVDIFWAEIADEVGKMYPLMTQ